MFLMVVGEDESARADYWKHRVEVDSVPVLYRIDSQDSTPVSSSCTLRICQILISNFFYFRCKEFGRLRQSPSTRAPFLF